MVLTARGIMTWSLYRRRCTGAFVLGEDDKFACTQIPVHCMRKGEA